MYGNDYSINEQRCEKNGDGYNKPVILDLLIEYKLQIASKTFVILTICRPEDLQQ